MSSQAGARIMETLTGKTSKRSCHLHLAILTSRIGYLIFKRRYLALVSSSQSAKRLDVALPKAPFLSLHRPRRQVAASSLELRGQGPLLHRHHQYHSLANLSDQAEPPVPTSRSRALLYRDRSHLFEDLKLELDPRSRHRPQRLLLAMLARCLASLGRVFGAQKTQETLASE
jgi:hypothetical protein